ncbi:MAG: response regulator [Deltaproteobacteria bacterium]|nr:MAG: response regulator [Deltaproteobacteria bacterium]
MKPSTLALALVRALLPPRDIDDPNRRRIAVLAHWVILVCEITMVAFLIVGAMEPHSSLHHGMTATTLAGFVVLHVLLHRGHLQAASVGVVGFGWVATIFSAAVSGGPESPALGGLVLIVIVAALLWGERAAVVAGALDILALVGLFVARVAGLLPEPWFSHTPLHHVLARTFHVLIATFAVYYAVRFMMQRQKDAEREARKAWMALRSRTAEEGRLRQALKMEAVGQLAGGIAHDFNNLLTVIRGNLEVFRIAPSSDDGQGSLDAAIEAIERGRELTNRLLSFSRKQPLEPEVIDPGELLVSLRALLRRTLGEGLDVQIRLAADLWCCEVDRNELESALINLVVNARDAMPEGGKVVIGARNLDVRDSWAMGADVPPGQYVVIEVRDFGTGMQPEVIERAFDPFFTTKPKGKGTGLGLSMVYGFVKQSGGHIEIESKPGRGTTVAMYLPKTDRAPRPRGAQVSGPHPVAGERILVVEDDPAVRKVAVRLLSALGYEPIAAEDGDQALQILERACVDALFTDVVLPGNLSGADLAAVAKERCPGLSVLFTSGYAHDVLVREGRLPPGVHLLKKPYAPEELHEALARILRTRRKTKRRPDAGTESIVLH